MCFRLRRAIVLAGFGSALFAAEKDSPCPNAATAYEGWRVNKVQVSTPFNFFASAAARFTRIRQTLPLQENEPFDVEKYRSGVRFITNAAEAWVPMQLATVRIVVTTDNLYNCDASARTLDVRYTVYTAFVPALSDKSFERREAEVERPATAAAAVGASGGLLLIPNVGYDHTRHGFGGISVQSRAPFGVFDHVGSSISISSNSFLENVALSSRRDLAGKYLARVSWQLISTYRALPVGLDRLKEGKLGASLFASTRELTSRRLVAHIGASFAGGHQQSAIARSNSSYGDLKLLGNVEDRWGANALAAAYGLQLGSTLAQRTVDFAKHIADVRYSAVFSRMPGYFDRADTCNVGDETCDDRPRFIGAAHKPISLDFRAVGGVIQAFGFVPRIERFFGGNQQYAPFIEGQPWDVRSQPYIRSIPEYRLGSSSPLSFGFGGTRFYSLNVTAAKAVAGKAVLPKELGTADFVGALNGAMNTATDKIADVFFSRDPAVTRVDVEVSELGREVANLELPDAASFDDGTRQRIARALAKASLRKKQIASIVSLITGKGQRNVTVGLINELVPDLNTCLDAIRNVASAAGRVDLSKAIEERQAEIGKALEKLKQSWTAGGTGSDNAITTARRRARRRAEEEVIAPAARVLNTVLYQLNAYSIAPVAVFDVARVWPSGVGLRYGVGGGMRVSIVNANFTIGYAANPVRLPAEAPGAFFFKLDVTDLFR